MNYAEWSGRQVKIYDQYKTIVRRLNVHKDVQCVQCSGSGLDGMVAITYVDGKTDLYKADGTIVRRG